MISEVATQRFLARALNSYDWLKKEGVEKINQALGELTPVPDIATLWLNQKICFLLIEALKRFMLFLDMGAGKTLIVLSILKYRIERGEKAKAIVFVPYTTSVSTWVDEAALRTPTLKCVPLLGTTIQNKQKLIEADGDIFVIAYASAVALLAEKVKVIGKKKIKWTLIPSEVRKVFAAFDMLVMDEVHVCQTVTSLTYKMLKTISRDCEYAVGLTGTPFGKNLMALWPQLYLIDFGQTLGPTLSFFREVFFTSKSNYWGGFEYKFKKRLLNKLKEIVKNSSIRYAIEELHDMPPRRYIKRNITPAQGIEAYVEKSLHAIKKIRADEDKGKYRAIESEYIKLRQLASGYMSLRGEDSQRIEISFDDNPKLEALEDIILGIAEDRKTIVFHNFRYTNKLISTRLKKLKIKHACVFGGQSNNLKELERFKTDPECRVLVLNDKMGSSSLNLQMANYIIFFEQPPAAIDRQQAERRVWRPGQQNVVVIIDLLMNGTFDHHINKWNVEGKDLLTTLLGDKDLTSLRV